MNSEPTETEQSEANDTEKTVAEKPAAKKKAAAKRSTAKKSAEKGKATAEESAEEFVEKMKEIFTVQLGIYGTISDEVSERLENLRAESPKKW